MSTKNPEQVGAGNRFGHRDFTTSRLQSLPYSKSLATISPINNELVLLFGDDANNWKYAKGKTARGEPVLLLPDENPKQYFWPIYGWDILAKQFGCFPLHNIPMLAQTLLSFGASVVRVLYRMGHDVGFVIYHNEVAHG